MQSGLSSTLKRVVTSRFDAALANKHLTLSETELTVLRIAGLPVCASDSDDELG